MFIYLEIKMKYMEQSILPVGLLEQQNKQSPPTSNHCTKKKTMTYMTFEI